MPAGLLVTVPVPSPATCTVNTYPDDPNPAVTLRSWLIETVQFPLPPQSPLHPVNVPPPACSCSVTVWLDENIALHVPLVHEMPAGVDVTVPMPFTVTLSVCMPAVPANVAVTARIRSMVTVHGP